MKTTLKTTLMAAVIASVLVIPAFAAESDDKPQDKPQGQGQNFEQKKVEILQHIREKIARDQEEIICVQSATSHTELKACREKFRPESRNDRPKKDQKGEN
ncbi:MAG: hypothetical protein HQK55_08080 [Deltaproteobacteria bacterium]|nr:hypothetical protein [Deltaproteobacteria bacterium]